MFFTLGLLFGLLMGAGGTWVFLTQSGRKRLTGPDSGGPSAAQDQSAELQRQQSEINDLRSRLTAAEEARARSESELAASKSSATAATPAPTPAPAEPSPPAAPRPVAASKTAAAPAPSAGDDLTKIKGIGPVLKDRLNAMGITTFRQIAEFTEADIGRINETMTIKTNIQDWVAQAKALAGR